VQIYEKVIRQVRYYYAEADTQNHVMLVNGLQVLSHLVN